jgi:hypothetical protein
MTTKQTRYRQKRLSAGYRQINLLLPGPAVEELDRRVSAENSTRLEVVKQWLQPDNSIIEK